MKKTNAWILITIAVIIGLYRMIQLLGVVNGLLFVFGLVALIGAIWFGLDRYYRWRSNRLVQSILPSETLMASGVVSESISDETPAILVRGTGDHYRLLVADSRGAVSVQSVTPELKSHANPKDLKSYIEVYTIQGPMHFAPRKNFLVAGQGAYAREILDVMLAGTSLPAGHPNRN